jgi:hypothetical protein
VRSSCKAGNPAWAALPHYGRTAATARPSSWDKEPHSDHGGGTSEVTTGRRDQWLFVLAGNGVAATNERRYPLNTGRSSSPNTHLCWILPRASRSLRASSSQIRGVIMTVPENVSPPCIDRTHWSMPYKKAVVSPNSSNSELRQHPSVANAPKCQSDPPSIPLRDVALSDRETPLLHEVSSAINSPS